MLTKYSKYVILLLEEKYPTGLQLTDIPVVELDILGVLLQANDIGFIPEELQNVVTTLAGYSFYQELLKLTNLLQEEDIIEIKPKEVVEDIFSEQEDAFSVQDDVIEVKPKQPVVEDIFDVQEEQQEVVEVQQETPVEPTTQQVQEDLVQEQQVQEEPVIEEVQEQIPENPTLADVLNDFSIDKLERYGFKFVNGQVAFYEEALNFIHVIASLSETGVEEGNKVLTILEDFYRCTLQDRQFDGFDLLEALHDEKIERALIQFFNKKMPNSLITDLTSKQSTKASNDETQTKVGFVTKGTNSLVKEVNDGVVEVSPSEVQLIAESYEGFVFMDEHLFVKVPTEAINMKMLADKGFGVRFNTVFSNGCFEVSSFAVDAEGNTKAITTFKNYITVEVLTNKGDTLREGAVMVKNKNGNIPVPAVVYPNSVIIKLLNTGVLLTSPIKEEVRDVDAKIVVEAVKTLIAKGVMQPLTTGKFVPTAKVTYYSLIEVITKALGIYKESANTLDEAGSVPLKQLVNYKVIDKEQAQKVYANIHNEITRETMFTFLTSLVVLVDLEFQDNKPVPDEFSKLDKKTQLLLIELDTRMVLKKVDGLVLLDKPVNRQELAYYVYEVMLLAGLI